MGGQMWITVLFHSDGLQSHKYAIGRQSEQQYTHDFIKWFNIAVNCSQLLSDLVFGNPSQTDLQDLVPFVKSSF